MRHAFTRLLTGSLLLGAFGCSTQNSSTTDGGVPATDTGTVPTIPTVEAGTPDGVVADVGGGVDGGAPVVDGGSPALNDATPEASDTALPPSDGAPVDGAAPSVGWLDCGSRDVTGATVVDDTIEKDTTWQGTVLLKGAVDVRGGVTLTILPGTRIISDVDSHLEIGWNSTAAAIVAEGTAEQPIRFCGKSAEAGFWGGITVRSKVTSNSVLRHVLISDAGQARAALELQADILIADVQVRNSGDEGVVAEDFKEGSARLSVSGAAKAPVVFTGPAAVTRFPLGGAFESNPANVARVRFDDIEVDTTFHALGLPYVQERTVLSRLGARVTFEPGIEYQFAVDTGLEIGWNSSDAAIVVNGSADRPVVFRGQSPQPGSWKALKIGPNVRSDSKLEFTKIMHGGGDEAPSLLVQSAITLKDVVLDTNAQGAEIRAQGVAAASRNLTITRTVAQPLTVYPDALFSIPRGGTFTGNTNDWISVVSDDITLQGTIANLGVPYRVLGNLDSVRGSSLIIEAGTVFEMSPDSHFQVGWNSSVSGITAVGTATAPIVFRGVNPVAGSWEGVILGRQVLTSSKLDYVHILHAGGSSGSDGAALRVEAVVPVTHSTFDQSAGWGIVHAETNTTDYTATNTFTAVALGSVSTY